MVVVINKKGKGKKSPFSKWYGPNKEEFNRKRRERYRKDPKYRAGQLKNTKEWKKRQPAPEKVSRIGFSLREAAEEIGCSVELLRNLESAGHIPKVATGGRHRIYTKRQVGLIRPLVEYRKEHHYKEPGYADSVAKRVRILKANW